MQKEKLRDTETAEIQFKELLEKAKKGDTESLAGLLEQLG